MKRKPILLAIALLLVVGAALWGVNYRLDHPPLTQADEEFRALVAGADGVWSSQWACQGNCDENWLIKYKPLDAMQTRELIENLRVVDGREYDSLAGDLSSTGHSTVELELKFTRQGKPLASFLLLQTPGSSGIGKLPAFKGITKINPRFNKRLNRVLDAYLPQRVRP